jgi:23S rRNA (adenine2030-N6)-methyltransferase
MFSYRHDYHAGNHADVLKHVCLIGVLRYLQQKEKSITCIDTHAGSGLYNLHSKYSLKSGESHLGFLKILQGVEKFQSIGSTIPPLLKDYLQITTSFKKGKQKYYPGSPVIMQKLLRLQDNLQLFELMPKDARSLTKTIGTTKKRQIHIFNEDGFTGLSRLLPPKSHRGFIFIDPSYEIKSDYKSVFYCVHHALTRFANGVYLVWQPIVPRTDTHQLLRKLKTLIQKYDKQYLQISLRLKTDKRPINLSHSKTLPKLQQSSLLIINPPYTFIHHLKQTLPLLSQWLDTHWEIHPSEAKKD